VLDTVEFMDRTSVLLATDGATLIDASGLEIELGPEVKLLECVWLILVPCFTCSFFVKDVMIECLELDS
jgi:hypothetical protein